MLGDKSEPRARLNPDTYGLILALLSTADLLHCACVCSKLKQLCDATLQSSRSLELRSTAVTGAHFLWLVRNWLHGCCVQINVSNCEHITKAQVAQAVDASPALETLEAIHIGPGSWSAKQLERLNFPETMKVFRFDCRVELKNDLDEGSALLAILERPYVQCAKLTLIADNLSSAAPATGVGSAAEVAAAAAAEMQAAVAAMQAVDIGDGAAAEEAAPVESLPALDRLRAALRAQHAHLADLDASSGALAADGSTEALLAPLIAAPAAALRCLSVCSLPHTRGRTLKSLSSALRSNRCLKTLELNSNMIFGPSAQELASALEGHPTISRLSLEHNPVLDPGGVAIASALHGGRIADLSLAFTGVADGTCEALALVLAADDCALRRLNLTGNRIGRAGAVALAGSLGPLRSLDMGANMLMDGEASCAVAKALPASKLRTLRLAGCGVDKKACAKIAAALPRASLTALDLSANHFGGDGSDEIAWALAESESLISLNLADCDLKDEAADELAEALQAEETKLRHLDLRWNRLESAHRDGKGISADPRADASSQKQKSAADRQNDHLEKTWQEAKAAGKKVHVPKWVREQQKKQKGGSASTGKALS